MSVAFDKLLGIPLNHKHKSSDVTGIVGDSEGQLALFNQSSHGFAALDAIYHNGTSWIKAQSDDANTLGLYVVIEVVDTDNFKASMSGKHTVSSHGLTAGEYYFVSDVTAGLLQITEPATYSNPLVFVEDADTIHVVPFRPLSIGGGGGGSSLWSETANILQPLTDGNGIFVDVPTASRAAIGIQTTDDSTTNNLFEIQNSSGTVLTNFTAEGEHYVRLGSSVVGINSSEQRIGSLIPYSDGAGRSFWTFAVNREWDGSLWQLLDDTGVGSALRFGETEAMTIISFAASSTTPVEIFNLEHDGDLFVKSQTTGDFNLIISQNSDQSYFAGFTGGATGIDPAFIYDSATKMRFGPADDAAGSNFKQHLVIDTDGSVKINENGSADNTAVLLEIEANASHTGNLFEIQTSTGSNLVEVDSSGFVGIGVNPTAKFHVGGTFTGASGSVEGSRIQPVFNPTGNSTATHQALALNTFTQGSFSFQRLYGINFTADHFGTGTMTDLIGNLGRARNGSTGTVTNMFACQVSVDQLNAGGTVTNAYGFHFDRQTIVGTMTNLYGLFIEDVDQATNNWAIRTNLGRVQFGDDVWIDSIMTLLADQTTDTAPNDDTTRKKLTLQKLSSPPTNAAYIAFSNNPGSDTFYLVMEES